MLGQLAVCKERTKQKEITTYVAYENKLQISFLKSEMKIYNSGEYKTSEQGKFSQHYSNGSTMTG